MILRSGLACLLFPVALTAQVPTLHVVGAGEGLQVAAAMHRGYPAIPVMALRGLGATVEARVDRAEVVLLGDTLQFELLSPFFLASQRVFQLAAPAYREGGIFYLPHQFFADWLPAHYSGRIAFMADTLRLIDAAAAPVVAVPIRPDSVQADTGRAVVGQDTAVPLPQRTVIIDPGHGGPDPGKVGPAGVREKDVTLALGLMLADSLESRGYEVHLTRSTDVHVPLLERARIANRVKAGRPATLFVSLHANSAAANVRGFETFFLSEARTDEERRVAEIENAAVRFDEDGAATLGELDHILNMLRNDYYLHASHALAGVIQREFAGMHPGPNRGVKQAGFLVLVGAFMPAVLVEVGFISNVEEARLLAAATFQRRLVSALTGAIHSFFETHEYLWTTAVR